MGGMLLATGLALSHWVASLPGLILFGIGTAIRIRSEEKLLKEAFGSEFDAYARRVGAVLPRLALREDPSYPRCRRPAPPSRRRSGARGRSAFGGPGRGIYSRP